MKASCLFREILEETVMPSRNPPSDAYRFLFENSMDAVLLTIPDGRIVAANPAACAMFGMTEAELRDTGRDRLVDTSDPRFSSYLEDRKRPYPVSPDGGR
jgi:PAS domain S-box-containing protein